MGVFEIKAKVSDEAQNTLYIVSLTVQISNEENGFKNGTEKLDKSLNKIKLNKKKLNLCLTLIMKKTMKKRIDFVFFVLSFNNNSKQKKFFLNISIKQILKIYLG